MLEAYVQRSWDWIFASTYYLHTRRDRHSLAPVCFCTYTIHMYSILHSWEECHIKYTMRASGIRLHNLVLARSCSSSKHLRIKAGSKRRTVDNSRSSNNSSSIIARAHVFNIRNSRTILRCEHLCAPAYTTCVHYVKHTHTFVAYFMLTSPFSVSYPSMYYIRQHATQYAGHNDGQVQSIRLA